MTPLRIVFFGSPEFAVPTLRALAASAHPVVGVVTQPDRPRGRGQKITPGAVAQAAADLGLPLLQPAKLSDAGVRETLDGWRADLGVVAAYGRILPPWLLAIPVLLGTYTALRWVIKSSTRITVADGRLRYQSGIASKTTRTLELGRIQDVTVTQSLGDRMLGLGAITIVTASETGSITMEQIDQPQRVAERILDLARNGRSGEGLARGGVERGER